MIGNLRSFSLFVYGMAYLAQRYQNMSVTSWGRSPFHNKGVGGVGDSEHITWTACDVEWDPGTRPDLATLEAEAGKMELQVIREKDHDHIQLRRTSV